MTITEQIKEELLKRTNSVKEEDKYDFWEDHIKYVVKNALELADAYNADKEIVELGALLHDIAIMAHKLMKNYLQNIIILKIELNE